MESRLSYRIIKIKVHLSPRLFYYHWHIPFILVRFFEIGVGQYEIKRFWRMEGKDEKVLPCMGWDHGGWQEGGAPSFFKKIPGHHMVVHFIYPVQGNVVLCKDFIFNAAGIGTVFQKDEGQGTAILYGWRPGQLAAQICLGDGQQQLVLAQDIF